MVRDTQIKEVWSVITLKAGGIERLFDEMLIPARNWRGMGECEVTAKFIYGSYEEEQASNNRTNN